MADEEKTLTYGQMGAKKAPPAYSEADVSRIVQQALQQAGVVKEAPPVEQDVPEEDKALVAEVLRLHPSARNVVVSDRMPVAGDLSHVKVSYYLATGQGKQVATFLVFDDGNSIHVYRGD